MGSSLLGKLLIGEVNSSVVRLALPWLSSYLLGYVSSSLLGKLLIGEVNSSVVRLALPWLSSYLLGYVSSSLLGKLRNIQLGKLVLG